MVGGMAKGQSALEYIVIIGFVLAVLIPLALYFYTSSKENNEMAMEKHLQQIADRITDYADKVYYLGKPSKISYEFYLPEKIQDAYIQGNEVNFKIRIGNMTADVYAKSKAPLNGTLPKKPGYHTITIESKGDYVWIS